MSSPKKLDIEVIKGTGITFSFSIVGKIINFLFHFLSARILGPAGYGVYTLGFSVNELFKSISTLGINRGGVLKLVAAYEGARNQSRLKGVVLGGFYITVITSSLISVGLFFISPVLAEKVFNQFQLTGVLRLFAFSIPFQVLILMAAAVAQARKQMKIYSLLFFIILPAANLLGLVIGFLFGLSIYGIVLSIVLAVVLGSFFAAYSLEKNTLRELKNVSPVFSNINLIRVSLPIVLVYLSGIVFKQADKLLLGVNFDPSTVGVYSLSYRLVWTMQLVILSLGIFPSIVSDLYHRKELHQLQALYSNIIRWVFALVFPIFLIINLFSKEILAVFGPEYVSGWKMLRVLSIFPLAEGLSAQNSPVLRMTGNQKYEAGISVVSTIFYVILINSLLPILGPLGAAVSTVLAVIVREALKMTIIIKKVKIQPYDSRLLPFVWSGLLAGGAVFLIHIAKPQWAGWGHLVFAGLSFAVTYIGLGLVIFPKDDREIINKTAVYVKEKISKLW